MLRLLWLLVVILVIIWLAGLVLGFLTGISLHSILVIAIILFIVWLIFGRR